MKPVSRVLALVAAAGAALAMTGCGTGESDQAGPAPSTPSASDSGGTVDGATAGEPRESSAPAESSSSPGQAPDASEHPPQDPDHCTSSQLSLALGQAGGTAGTTYRSLEFTNAGDFPCVLQGFPGVSYVAGDDGHQVGKAAEHVGDKGAAMTLYPGEVAHADIGFTQVRNYDTAACDPTSVRGLRVYPPQETASMFVEIPGTGCASEAIAGNQLTVATMESGSGGR